MFFLGIDLGTQGVRGLVISESGEVVSGGTSRFSAINLSDREHYSEQSAGIWTDSVIEVISQCIEGLAGSGYGAGDITGIGVDGTSGTILPLDSDFKPLANALMYNDSRAEKEASIVQNAGSEIAEKLGYRYKSTFSLPKILWVKNNMPEIYKKTSLFLHQSDYITGFLSGNYGVSDYSNALKSGYDLIDNRWPEFISDDLDIPLEKLPEVHVPGTVIGTVSEEIAALTGLSVKTKVCVGATDGIASALASGIKKPGDYNTTIGTTLVIKGISGSIIRDPEGRIYSHRHPDGYWIPGAASNTGGICLNHYFPGKDFSEFDMEVNLDKPTGVLCYPLIGKGERFPFIQPEAEGFTEGDLSGDISRYTALMEGVAYIERLSYDVMEDLGADRVETVYAAGGAAKSDVWLQLRANVLNRRIVVPKVVEAAMGAAVLAASGVAFNGTSEAVEGMVKIDREFLPSAEAAEAYNSEYGRFKEACRVRGYIK